MRYLLMIDLKSVKKIIMIYYLLILGSTLLINFMLGWVIILFVVKIERDICKENIIQNTIPLYRNLPKGNLYVDEKNVLYYLIIIGGIIIWSGTSFFCIIPEYPALDTKIRMIIGLGMIMVLVCNLYHASWMCVFLRTYNVVECMQQLNKYYIGIFVLGLIVTKNSYVYEKLKSLFLFEERTCFWLFIINILLCGGTIIMSRRIYKKSELR